MKDGAFIEVVWCDDIRQEIGNKISFMGVYTGGLVLTQVPAALTKLCVWAAVSVPANRLFEKMNAELRKDDGTVIARLPEQQLGEEYRNAPRDKTILSTFIGLEMAPMLIPADCRFIEVVAIVDGEEVHGKKLWITTTVTDAEPMPADPNVVSTSPSN